ncbi:MAG: cytochrome c oxidase subunit II [Acidimicrobiia bacterium]|nr:cytochrome c oxidase subunit II [Acidimicrobiia bacterium]
MSEESRDDSVETSLHLDPYEKNWMRLTLVLLVVFAAAVTIAGFALGFQVPSPEERVNPQTVAKGDGPFADPGLREYPNGSYDLYIVSQMFAFTPNEVTVKVGSEVTFYVTSVDVQHGFKIQNTNVNMQIVPGQVSKLAVVFDEPGTYDFICTEYCGSAHAQMYGTLTVEK